MDIKFHRDEDDEEVKTEKKEPEFKPAKFKYVFDNPFADKFDEFDRLDIHKVQQSKTEDVNDDIR